MSRIHDDMDKLGYTKVAAQIALEKLKRKGFIDVEVRNIYDQFANESYDLSFYNLTDKAIDWIIENEDKLQLRIEHKQAELASHVQRPTDDIPF